MISNSPTEPFSGVESVIVCHHPEQPETTQKEVQGFYCYSWASEVFVVCAMGSFIPVTLEQLARARGVLASDRTTPCDVVAPSSTHSPPNDASQCVFSLFGRDLNTASFAMYVFGISVLVQTAVIVCISGIADRGHKRRGLLTITAVFGSIATALFVFVSPDSILVAAVLAIVANTCFGASSVMLNSYLPLLVKNDRNVREDVRLIESQNDAQYETGLAPPSEYGAEMGPFSHRPSLLPKSVPAYTEASSTKRNSYIPLLSPGDRRGHGHVRLDEGSSSDRDEMNPIDGQTDALVEGVQKQIAAVEIRRSGEISTSGVAYGYTAAIIVQLLCIGIVVVGRRNPLSASQYALGLIGVWWLSFSVIAVSLLQSRAVLLMSSTDTVWATLKRAFVTAWHSRDLLMFLLAWFMLSDAIATTSGTAILFAKTSLNMSPSAVAAVSILSTLFGVVGAFTWRQIRNYYKLGALETMVCCTALFAVIPFYSLLGYIPFISRLGFGGLQTATEMYILAAIYGFILGGISSYARTVYSQLIPPGSEAVFFSLYAITDKGSSVFGPTVVGYITNHYSSIRPAFFVLAVLVITPIPLLLKVQVARGQALARSGEELPRRSSQPNLGPAWSQSVPEFEPREA